MAQRLLTMDEPPKGAITCRNNINSIVSTNEDLMVNILSRLPVKALSRFRCVSKQWNMLISDPYFVSAHQARAAQDPNMMKVLCMHYNRLIRVCSIEEKDGRMVTLDLIRPNSLDSFPLEATHYKMAGRPCNGLICLIDGRITLVCNPATRNTLVLPTNKEGEHYHVQGLGFCSTSNEFKVVRLFDRSKRWEEREGYGCELFVVAQRGARRTNHLQDSRSWRHVGNLPCQIRSPFYEGMRYANGGVHWIIKPVSNPITSDSKFILSLDLELEEFKVVSWPVQYETHEFMREHHLNELGGKLCAVVVFSDVSARLFDIWVLEDHTNSIWSKKYHINLRKYWYLNSISVFALSRGRFLLKINGGQLIYRYDPRSDFFKQVITGEISLWEVKVHPYVESLFIPD